jgi:integrase
MLLKGRYILAKMQRGSLRVKSGSWYVRFRVTEYDANGQPKSRRLVSKRLCPHDEEYRSKQDVWPLADKEVAKESKGGSAEGSLLVSDFVTRFFLPFVEAKKRASTLRFYRDTIKRNITPAIGHKRLRDVETVHIQTLLDSIDLSQGSLLRIKSAASAVFSHAKRRGAISVNPVQGAKAEGRRSDFESHAYSLADLQFFFEKLDEPARTVVGTAAFSGLRESEIRGLQWPDYTGAELFVRRAVWRTAVDQTKTQESKSVVPVISPLRKMLDAHRKRNGDGKWIFSGEKKGFALNLDNLARREIMPLVGERWHGWHGWRRGLATILFDLGVDPEVASKILRHADSAVTRRHYIVLESRKQGRIAMKKLESLVTKTVKTTKSKKKPPA